MARTQSKMIFHPGDAESVRVMAHTRKKPAKLHEARNVKTTAQHATSQLADNSFGLMPEPEQDAPAITGGLAGEPAVNHLKAAVGLLRSKRRV